MEIACGYTSLHRRRVQAVDDHERERNYMSRSNLDPLMTFADGSHLVVSTQCSKDGAFSCALYRVLLAPDDGGTFQIVSNHLAATTCLNAQEHAYTYGLQLYRGGGQVKKPPYLMWAGPRAEIVS